MIGFTVVVDFYILNITQSCYCNIYRDRITHYTAICIGCHELLCRHKRRISNQCRITRYTIQRNTCIDLKHFFCNSPAIAVFDLLIGCEPNRTAICSISLRNSNTVGTILTTILDTRRCLVGNGSRIYIETCALGRGRT